MQYPQQHVARRHVTPDADRLVSHRHDILSGEQLSCAAAYDMVSSQVAQTVCRCCCRHREIEVVNAQGCLGAAAVLYTNSWELGMLLTGGGANKKGSCAAFEFHGKLVVFALKLT